MRPDHARVAAYLESRPRRMRLSQKHTFTLYWVQGLSCGQLAKQCGITMGAATLRVYRLRRAMRRWEARR